MALGGRFTILQVELGGMRQRSLQWAMAIDIGTVPWFKDICREGELAILTHRYWQERLTNPWMQRLNLENHRWQGKWQQLIETV